MHEDHNLNGHIYMPGVQHKRRIYEYSKHEVSYAELRMLYLYELVRSTSYEVLYTRMIILLCLYRNHEFQALPAYLRLLT